MVYKFFLCCTKIPCGLSAYKPQKLVVYCLITSTTVRDQAKHKALESEIMWGMAKFGKRAKKCEGAAVRRQLSFSVPSGFSCPLCRSSPPSRSLEQASKRLKNKSSPCCAFMFHGCITSTDMKYLLRHVPVTLISPINRCNFLLLLWKIAGKWDQCAGCHRQPAAILNPGLEMRPG